MGNRINLSHELYGMKSTNRDLFCLLSYDREEKVRFNNISHGHRVLVT